MLRRLLNNQAQAVVGEYVIVIFVVIMTLVAMTVYFKRSVQSRIHDARDYMVNEVRARTAGSFDGNLYLEYEPYYTSSSAQVKREMAENELLEGNLFKKGSNYLVETEAASETAPPKDFNATTPRW